MVRNLLLAFSLFLLVSCGSNEQKTIWEIGKPDNSAAELALGPANYKDFLSKDFGYEDQYFLIGHSVDSVSFPYVIPGPVDQWGGTWSTSGWRTHELNVLFGVDKLPETGEWKLVIDLLDNSKPHPPLFKVTINNKQEYLTQLEPGGGDSSIFNLKVTPATEKIIEIPINPGVIKQGGNCITLAILQGSWLLFDAVRLEGPGQARLLKPEKVFVRNAEPANYEIDGYQPLIIDVEHLSGNPVLSVELDGKKIFEEQVDSARYQFEALMPAVTTLVTSNYKVLVDGKVYEKGTVNRQPEATQTKADYVDTKIGTAHSRWMIAPGPWMPFSMVKMSPDNQNAGWQAGYQPTFETVGCFSHIHEWTMGGLGMLPTNGPLKTTPGDQFDPDGGYRSRIDKLTEEAPIGFYKVQLTDYDILAEVTATTRCGFQRYTFPKDKDDSRVIIDLHIPAEYDYRLEEIQIKQVSDTRIEGFSHQKSPYVWSHDADQEYTVHFVIEFDQPIASIGGWLNDEIVTIDKLKGKNLKNAGAFVQFNTKENNVVQARSGISLVSVQNASLNLKTEIADVFGWSFDAVKDNQLAVWNDLFDRVDITTTNRLEKVRFYTNMYRALCSRNTWSDVNGQWVSTDKKVRQLANSDDVALGCDAFWNTFWNLNQFWNLVTPEWSNRWVNSQLAMYNANGWLAKGPAGMKYIPVMVAEHEIPLIVGAYQMGIRDFDAEKAFEAVKKMQTTPSQKVFDGYAGNRDLVSYLKYKYVPSDLGRFSNTLEYSFDDWTVGQFAKALGKEADFKVFDDRGTWWRNAIEPDSGYAQMRTSDGEFVKPFDPFHSGKNDQYVEGNAWQLTYFVPQDVPALASVIGKDRFIDRLDWGFKASEVWRYNAPNDQYWDYPVVQGNQQSMHFAFLFNWVDKPWMTQRWSRSIIERYYGVGEANAYLGDEDQGQMSAWLVMASMGLFQTDGGCRVDPIYEIASPLYPKIVVNLGERYSRGETFTIEAKNASRKNMYVQSAVLNGKKLDTFYFPASELLKGGSLVLEMGPEPNTQWGLLNNK